MSITDKYRAEEPRYLWYCGTKKYRKGDGTGTVEKWYRGAAVVPWYCATLRHSNRTLEILDLHCISIHSLPSCHTPSCLSRSLTRADLSERGVLGQGRDGVSLPSSSCPHRPSPSLSFIRLFLHLSLISSLSLLSNPFGIASSGPPLHLTGGLHPFSPAREPVGLSCPSGSSWSPAAKRFGVLYFELKRAPLVITIYTPCETTNNSRTKTPVSYSYSGYFCAGPIESAGPWAS